MEKSLETLLSELETAAYNQGYHVAHGSERLAYEAKDAVASAKDEIIAWAEEHTK